jgi:hypothetical protein
VSRCKVKRAIVGNDSERKMSAVHAKTGAEMACEMTEAIELKKRAQLKAGRLQMLDEGGQMPDKRMLVRCSTKGRL